MLHAIGQIAKRFRVNTWQVTYVIKTRNILPVGWGGNARLFSDEAAEMIGAELVRIHGDAA